MAEEKKTELIVVSQGGFHDRRGAVQVNIVVDRGSGGAPREGVQVVFPDGQRRTSIGFTAGRLALAIIDPDGLRKRVEDDDVDDMDVPSPAEELRDDVLSRLMLGELDYPAAAPGKGGDA